MVVYEDTFYKIPINAIKMTEQHQLAMEEDYMEGYIDMHIHILPGVDDGAKDVADMKAMLQIAYDEGIRCMIATPHHHPDRGNAKPEVLKRQAVLLRDAAHAIDEHFRIYLGTEIYFGQNVLEELKNQQILTMNRRNYVLIEFTPSETFLYICQSLQQLQMSGHEVILAHVERYRCIREHIESAEQLHKMGIHLQINAGSIIGDSGRKVKRFVQSLMEQDIVFCVGTDAHAAKIRAPRMKKAAEYVGKKYGEEYKRRIFFGNAMRMLRKIR